MLSGNFFVARSVAQSRIQLYFSQRIAAIDNTIAQCNGAFSQLVSQFYESFNKGACVHFSFFVLRSIARQVAEKIAV